MSDFFSSEKSVRFIEKLLNKTLGGMADALHDGPSFIGEAQRNNDWFYEGNTEFLTKPTKKAHWHLGYAFADVTPYDYQTHDYYLGGYKVIDNGFNNKIDTLVDKMACRIICLDDNSGRGATLFAVLDAIGLGNSDILKIRRRFADLLKVNGIDATICTVNICSTHTHSCVDTQGLWTDTGKKLLRNLKKNKTGRGTFVRGADEDYMNRLTFIIAQKLLEAYRNMVPGTMTFAKKDIGTDYFNNKNRASATALNTYMNRFVFTPDDKNLRPTMLVNLPAHPDVAGLPTADKQGTGHELCGDYIYYMGEHINRAGYNFFFINGAICAIYMCRDASNDGVSFQHRYEQSIRYGTELARIALSLTKSIDEIKQDKLLYDEEEIKRDTALSNANGVPYTLWCENWQSVKEKTVAPILNIRMTQVNIPVTNPLIKLVGKLNLVDYPVVIDGKNRYHAVTEAGFIQIGKDFAAVAVPGEFCQDLWMGGKSLTAEGSYRHRDFELPYIEQVFGECASFGLVNDAIGYIVPDNDYILGEFGNHYHELISLGEKTGSSILKALYEMKEKTKLR